jgi:hypothetical protein
MDSKSGSTPQIGQRMEVVICNAKRALIWRKRTLVPVWVIILPFQTAESRHARFGNADERGVTLVGEKHQQGRKKFKDLLKHYQFLVLDNITVGNETNNIYAVGERLYVDRYFTTTIFCLHG